MSNQPVTPGEMPTTPEPEKVTVAQPEPKPALTPEQALAELEATRKALKDANREAAERRKKLEAYEKAEAEKAAAELSETERRKKQLEDTAAKLRAVEIANLKQRTAAAAGLPPELADRLQGETEDDLKADAAALVKLMPPKQPKAGPTNPAEGRQESSYERGARLVKEAQGGDIWTGGGVRWPTDK